MCFTSHFEDVFLKAAETKRLEDHGEAKATHFPAPNTRCLVHEKYVYRINLDGLSWTYLKTVNVCDKDINIYCITNILLWHIINIELVYYRKYVPFFLGPLLSDGPLLDSYSVISSFPMGKSSPRLFSSL